MYITKFRYAGFLEGVEIHVVHNDAETAIDSNNQEFIEQFLKDHTPEPEDLDHELGFLLECDWEEHKFVDSTIYKLPEKSVTPTEDYFSVHLCADEIY